MNREEQQRYYELGKDYWWLAGKYHLVAKFISTLELRPTPRILDFGCGPGNMRDLLPRRAEVTSIEPSFDALWFCHSRGYDRLVQAVGESLPLEDEGFDLVVAIDVLEHIEDDVWVMQELYRVCAPGAFLVLTVPAFQFLWGEHDTRYGHKRRHTARSLKVKLERAGFSVTKLSYIHMMFAIPLWLWRKAKAAVGAKGDDFISVPSWLNRVLTFVVSVEGDLVRRFDLPFGSSMICVARKQASIEN